jgi:hypothetical protein
MGELSLQGAVHYAELMVVQKCESDVAIDNTAAYTGI